MKKTIFVKIPTEDKEVKSRTEPFRIMVNVCAWCPREEYPHLKDLEEYTHGLCDKHYKILTTKHKTT